MTSIATLLAAGVLGGAAAKQYYLYDAFTDTRAAGAVNGTPSTPPAGVQIVDANGNPTTPPLRTVTDTNSKLSVGAGVASFATGGVGAGDPGLWYPSIARVFGTALLQAVSLPSNNDIRIGWASASKSVTIDGIRFDGGQLKIFNAGAALLVGAQSAVPYSVASIMRASGYYHFIKGGTFASWTLLWVSSAGSAAVFPAAFAGLATTVFTDGNIRVPVALFIPTPLTYDTFTRANGVLGNSETSGPDAQGVTARAWTSQAGTWGVATGKAAASALAGGLALATVDVGTADVLLDATCTRAAGVVGLVARYQSSTDYLIAYHDGTNAKLDKVVAGVTTNLISAAVAIGAGGLRLILSGTSAWLFLNGAAVGSVATVPASSFTAHGLYTTDTGATFDNATVWPRGTGNEHGGLDAL